MPWIVTTKYGTLTFGGVAGKWWYTPPKVVGTAAAFVEVPFPSGVIAIDQRPSYCQWTGDGKSRLYSVGGHTDNLVFTENLKLLRQGIQPPSNPIASGAGSGVTIGMAATAASGVGRTGQCVGYVSWWDDTHKRRSPLSGAGPAIALSGQGVAWTNLPTAPADGDPSVTHIELWVAMDGLTPRLATRRDLGATAVTEEVPELSLGEPYDEDFTAFPRCKYNVAWHDRQVMAGDDHYPDRVYFSVLNEFERYANFYLRTRKGERVTALYSVRDSLFVCSNKATYVVTGYTEDDVVMDIFEPAIGCIAHHGVALVHGIAIVPTHLGFYANTGDSMHYISEGFGWTWRSEYQANQAVYESGWAVNDVDSSLYKFCIYGDAPWAMLGEGSGTWYWCLDYSKMILNEAGGFGSPDLIFDHRTRHDSCAGAVLLPDGRRSDLLTGSAGDGTIRFENVKTDTADDADNPQYKELRLMTKHYFFAPPGGNEDDGCYWPTMWMFMQHESSYATVKAYYGDESANTQQAAQYVLADMPPTSKSETVDGTIYTYVPKTRMYCQPRKSGAGITVEFVVSAPYSDRNYSSIQQRVEWRGFGGTYLPGRNIRPVASASTPG